MKKEELEHTIGQVQSQWLALGLRFFGGDESDARDALQETLLRLWVVRDRLNAREDVMALGTRIMKNECVNIYRQRQHLSYSPPPDTPAVDSSPQLTLEAGEHRELLHWAVDNLPQTARCVLQLHLYDEMSLDEISAATGKTKGAVKTMITRAKQQISIWLKTRI